MRCEVITGYPSGDLRANVNDIHSQSFDNLQEYPSEAKDVRPHVVHTSGHFMYNEST